MRTSGASGRDGLMTVVPLMMLIVFVMWMTGGPRASLVWLERTLGSVFDWVGNLLR